MHFAHLRHQDPKRTLGIDDACDAVYALLQTAIAVRSKNFLLKVSYLGVPVKIQVTLTILTKLFVSNE